MIQLDGVSKRYGDVHALHPLTLTFEAGRTAVLVGPSGCGKSTLLRLVVGLVAPDAGTVRVLGTPLGPATLRALRRRMGYVIQEGGLFPHLTARDNVTLMARQLGWPAARIDARVAALAELVQLPPERLRDDPLALSGGQRQRVGLMRALMLDPDVLLLDEPLGALDPMIRADLQADLRRIFHRLQKTVVLVTHDLHEAAALGDEILLLRAGRLVQRGTMDDLLRQPADPFVVAFTRAQHAAPAAPTPATP